MKELIIGCKNIEDEITEAIRRTGSSADIRWTEGGLHYVPDKLCSTIQAELDGIEGYDRVLIAMGYCGGAMSGLATHDFTMVIPRVDDCISLLLGSCQRKLDLTHDNGSYFMTEGWLHFNRNIYFEYLYSIYKYGQELADEIFHTMFGHYRSLVLIDTGCYPLEETMTQTVEIAKSLHLEHRVETGTIDFLCRLLAGPWDDDSFLVVPPDTKIDESSLKLPVNMIAEGGTRIG